MTDDQQPVNDAQRPAAMNPEVAQAVHLSMLNTMNTAIAAQVGLMLTVPVPADMIINIMIEHAMKVVALIEPEQLRNTILAEIRRNLAVVLNRHVEARGVSAGGVFIPPGARVRPN